MKSAEQLIVKTLAFYETRGCGRSASQLFACLLNYKTTQIKLEKVLEQMVESEKIVRVKGYFGFSAESANRAIAAAAWANKKRPIAVKIAKVMAKSPFIYVVALAQSVAMETAKDSSDVDIFTITAANRLWTARFFALARLKFAGLVKQKGNTADLGCFGFWIDESALNLFKIAIKDDIDLSFLVAHVNPLLNRYKTYEKYISKNRRLLERFPNWKRKSPLFTSASWRIKGGDFFEWLLSGKIGNVIELMLFRLQANKIWKDDIAHRAGASVITSKTMCKLHHFDKRTEIRDRWKKIVKEKSAV